MSTQDEMNRKAKYIQDLVNKFDKEDVESGMFDVAESAVGPIPLAIGDAKNYLQINRLTEVAGESHLMKVVVKP
jgi:hypothetical protein